MNAPIDQNASARLRFRREIAAQSGDTAVISERAADVINLAEFALPIHFFEELHRFIITVADPDI